MIKNKFKKSITFMAMVGLLLAMPSFNAFAVCSDIVEDIIEEPEVTIPVEDDEVIIIDEEVPL